MLGPHPEEHSPVFDAAEIVWVHSYAATNAKGEYHVAFGIGDGMMLTEVANAALERASLFATDRTKLFVQLVDRRDTAARRVTHTLRDAEPGSLVFIGFRDSMLVDAGMAALHADPAITVIAPDGTAMRKLTAAMQQEKFAATNATDAAGLSDARAAKLATRVSQLEAKANHAESMAKQANAMALAREESTTNEGAVDEEVVELCIRMLGRRLRALHLHVIQR